MEDILKTSFPFVRFFIYLFICYFVDGKVYRQQN